MSEKFSRVYEKEDIDAIIAPVFSYEKDEIEGMFNANSMDLLLDENMNTNIKIKVIPINMRKLAAYNNAIAKAKKNVKENVILPIVLRKRALLDMNKRT